MGELTFKSAGVKTREIDLSQPRRTGPIGVPAGIIGTSQEGPAYVPLTFSNYGDFAETFGKSDGKKFGPLAVNQWLANAQAVTYMRVLGAGDGKQRNSTTGNVTNAGFVVGSRTVQDNGNLGDNPFATSGVGAVEGRTYFLGCFMSESNGSTIFSDAGIQKTTAASGISSTATNAIDTDGLLAGIGGSNVEFTINVPANAGGEGGIITIVCQDDDDTGDTGKGANKIVIGGNSGLGDPSWQDLILAAINGDTTTGRITFATTGRGQSGVGGVTATNGTSNKQINLTIDRAGVNGNSAALASTAGVNIIDVTSFTGGVNGNHAVPILRGVLLAPSGVILHLSGNADDPGVSGAPAKTDKATVNKKGDLTGSVNLASQEFVMLMNGYSNSDVSKKTVITASFDMTAPNYFANVFNRDPLRIEEEGHLLYGSYDIYPDLAVITGSGAIKVGSYSTGTTNKENISFLLTSSLGRNVGSTTIPNYENFEDRFTHAKSPFVISQKFGSVNKSLFRIHLLSDGENVSNKFKFSIENIRKSKSDLDKFGTFDLLVRDFYDTDEEQVVLESFRGLSLDPTSDRYIARVIGDQHIYYNFDAASSSQKIIVKGSHPVSSKYIRVEMATSVDNGTEEQEALPFGYRGFGHVVTSGSILSKIPDANVFTRTSVTQEVVEPPVPHRQTVALGIGIQKRSDARLYWGIQTTRKTSQSQPNLQGLFDNSFNTYVKHFPGHTLNSLKVLSENSDASDAFNNNKFSLEHILVRTGSDTNADPEYWLSASYVRNGNISVNHTNKTRAFKVTDLEKVGNIKFAKFTFIAQGGFNGNNIFDKDRYNLENNAVKRELDDTSAAGVNDNTTAAYRKAIDVMASKTDVDIQLLATPGIRHAAVTDYAIQKIENRFDAMYIMDIEERDQTNAVITSSLQSPHVLNTVTSFKNRSLDTSFAASYFPDVVIKDPDTRTLVQVPPSVSVLGAYSLNDRVAHPWYAPAGFTRGALNTVEMASVRLNRTNLDDLYESDINPIADFPGVGITIWGQKTLQAANSALDRINVRRLLIDVRRKVKAVANTLLFEPNREETLEKFTSLVNPILQRVQEQSGVERYKAIIDTTTTTQADVENNTIRGKIYLQPTRSIEFVALDFVVTNAGSNI